MFCSASELEVAIGTLIERFPSMTLVDETPAQPADARHGVAARRAAQHAVTDPTGTGSGALRHEDPRG